MGDVVRAVAGWVERMRDTARMETAFTSAGVQELADLGVGNAVRPALGRNLPRLSLHLHGLYACEGGVWIGFGDTPAEAWEHWRSRLPWSRRWFVPRARAPKRPSNWRPTRALPPAPPPAGWEPRR